MLRAETRWFGPYPFETAGALVDRIRVSFAMENQTRPIYVPAFWQATTAPTLGDDVVVHELAHQWYGDSVALRRWRDIWLNEGFATYAEWLWNQRELGFTPQNFFDNYYARPADANFWNLRIGNPGSQRIFDLPIYIRGAMTLHALRTRIGDDDFFRVLRRWAQGRRNGHGTTPQLVRLAERVSGRRSLDRLFDTWLLRGSKPPRPQTRSAAAFTRATLRWIPRPRRASGGGSAGCVYAWSTSAAADGMTRQGERARVEPVQRNPPRGPSTGQRTNRTGGCNPSVWRRPWSVLLVT